MTIRADKLFFLALLFVTAVASADPVCWSDGTWDEDGAPKGVLLSDNPGWWGRSVFTGVDYVYEQAPTNPKDILERDHAVFGRRLLDGRINGDWAVPVGKTGAEPLVAVFDFKRPCRFSEVDLFSSRSQSAHGMVETGPDGKVWAACGTFRTSHKRTRIRLDARACGRYLRLSFKADNGITYLDEVLAWGEGEVSARYPEAIAGIDPGDVLNFTHVRDAGIAILPMPRPTLDEKPGLATSVGMNVVMARNETETRYFAVVNAGGKTERVALTPPDFSAGIKSELYVGGVVRMTRPPVKLTDRQINDLLITDLSRVNSKETNRLDVLPFFAADAIPERNFARCYLANPNQVTGFPKAVPLAPGEGCVIMLRMKTDMAPQQTQKGFLRAGRCLFPLTIDVRDIALPQLPLWIHAYSPFTGQFPFETLFRFKKDVERLAALGVSSCYGLPEPGSKQELLRKTIPHTVCAGRNWVAGRIIGDVYHGKLEEFDSTNRAAVSNGVLGVVKRARELGLRPEDYCLFLPDEPGRHNAALVGELARIMKSAAPELQIYMNPCFWERGFPPESAILDCLKPYYNEVIDISCPIMNLVRADNRLTKELWTAKRRVNAQYIHPAKRAGRKIAWSSFANGLNGFAYYCYYSPRGNPWDIRTWKNLDYNYQMVFPLGDDVAITPLYELMREAWEDYRLLTALRDTGKNELLEELLSEFNAAWDYTDEEKMNNGSDFQSLRDRALSGF